jgi:hypothetical protein
MELEGGLTYRIKSAVETSELPTRANHIHGLNEIGPRSPAPRTFTRAKQKAQGNVPEFLLDQTLIDYAAIACRLPCQPSRPNAPIEAQSKE